MKYLLITLTLFASLYAKQNINYAKSDLHTLTPPKGNLEFSLNLLMMNDTIDILNMKEKEFGNSSKFDAMGDLEGFDLALRYSPLDDLMLSLKYTNEEIQYASTWLKNTRLDLYARYHILQNSSAFFNSGLSIDVGYVSNTLDDLKVNDVNSVKDILERKIETGTFDIPASNALRYTDVNNVTSVFFNPFVKLHDTEDKSYYLRLLTGFHTKSTYTDFYTGIKTTTISNAVSASQSIMLTAAGEGYTFPLRYDRDEKTLFLGVNHTIDVNPWIYELNYEYRHFLRDDGLDYINSNHIINAFLSYGVTKNFLMHGGVKIMYRQLNGEIPYLYNEETQTSYDHKYGYASFGITYNFR